MLRRRDGERACLRVQLWMAVQVRGARRKPIFQGVQLVLRRAPYSPGTTASRLQCQGDRCGGICVVPSPTQEPLRHGPGTQEGQKALMKRDRYCNGKIVYPFLAFYLFNSYSVMWLRPSINASRHAPTHTNRLRTKSTHIDVTHHQVRRDSQRMLDCSSTVQSTSTPMPCLALPTSAWSACLMPLPHRDSDAYRGRSRK